MDYYSNLYTLQLAYGDVEVEGLLRDGSKAPNELRLEKACKQAYDEINDALHTAGYVVPLTFEPYTAEAIGTLHGTIQRISDAFTAQILGSSEDLAKKRYDDQAAAERLFLEQVMLGNKKIYDLERTDPKSGRGDAYTLARQRMFDVARKSESEILCRGDNGSAF